MLQFSRQLHTLLQILLSHPHIDGHDQPTLSLFLSSLASVPLVYDAQDGFQVGATSESCFGIGAGSGSELEVGAGGGWGWEEEGGEDGKGDLSDGGWCRGEVVDRWEECEEADNPSRKGSASSHTLDMSTEVFESERKSLYELLETVEGHPSFKLR